MKNYNLIEWLWKTDSHEKQTPQRFGRYAVMLIMLLTLGVGQMWGWNFGGNYGNDDVTIWFDNSATQLSNIKIYFENGQYSQDYSFSQIAGTDYWTITTHYAGYNKYEIHGTPKNSSDNWGWKTNAKGNGEEIYSGWLTRCFSPSTTSGQAGSWTVPGQKSVSYTRNSTTTANTLAGSGTSGSPYIIKPGTAIGVELSGTAIDGSCTKYYKFGSSTASTTNTKQVVASCVAGTTYSMEGYTGAKRDTYESRYASAGTLYFKAAYTISAAVSGENGSVSITSGGNYVYTGNTSFTVTATPDSGYEVDTWTVTGGTKTGSGNSITVSASNSANCTVTVTFRAIPASSHTISYTTVGTGWSYGTAPSSAEADETVTFVVNPTAGYTVSVTSSDVTLSGPNASNQYTFTMPDDDVAISVSATENKSSVTIVASPSGAGTFSPASPVLAGVATKPSVTATAVPGYKFSSWAITGGATISSTSTNPTTVTGKGAGADATLVANFVRTYAFVEGRFHITNASRNGTWTNTFSSGNWDESSTRIPFEYDNANHRFYLHTYATPKELTTQISGYNPFFYIKTSTASGSLTNVTSYWSATSTTITTAGTGGKKTLVHTGTLHNDYLRFNSSDESGYVVIYFDEAGVWYELEQSLKYDANGGTGSAPATAYYLKGTNAPAASNPFTARTNYTFAGWNTDQYITGTNYAAGASVPMNTNRMLYAKWDRTVTLEQEGATTEGSTTVIGTWNCATLPAITNPKKTGYTFGGWYTEVAGAGNLIIDTEGVLQADKTNWTDASGRFQRTPSAPASESKPLYAKWTQTVTLNANTGNHGSGSNTTATIVYKATAKSSITHCTPATGYHLEGYYTAETDGVKVLNADGSFASSAVTDYITDGKWTKAGATTLYAHYEPNTYDVILDVNGATTGSNQTVVATFDAAMPTTQKTSGDAITAPSKTGYTFGGYYANSNGTGTQYYTSGLANNHVWDVATNNTHIYAKWTANPYTITLTQSGETGYGSAGTASVTATYDAALPTISSLPTAANGYSFMGYYTDHNGEGTQYYDATGTKLVASYTTADDLELFAYFKKAEITGITFTDGAVVAPSTSKTVTAAIEPTPTGTTTVCWRVLYSNDNPLDPQPAFTPVNAQGTSVSFIAPEASGMYKLEAVLHLGSGCSGEEVSTYVTTFQVAGDHTVTVQYKCGNTTIKASTSVTGKPLEWTEITAPEIVGYSFSKWVEGDGITIEGATEGEKASATINFKAIYDGKLTAVYTQKRMIYFYNTLNWENVYVYFYSGSYWNNDNGTGSNTGGSYTGINGQMQPISEGSKIYYFDAEAAGVNASYTYVSFTELHQNNTEFFEKTGTTKNKVIYRSDYKSTTLPMFVPVANQTPESKNSNQADYYNKGYWMNYPANSGYTLRIYDTPGAINATGASREFLIPFSEDVKMPLKQEVEVNFSGESWFIIYRNDGKYLEGSHTFKQTDHGDKKITSTADASNAKKMRLISDGSGIYTFTLTFRGDGGENYDYYLNVDFPAAVGDYRIVYSDNATWSNGAHSAGWYHPSDIIGKNTSETEAKEDTVSFFISHGSSPSMKFQRISAISESAGSYGQITWEDVPSGSITIPTSIEAPGVYNFIVTQPAGGASISLVKAEPYTGNYYIRTDCAGETKWNNFRSPDHLITYSEYSITHGGYSHYYAHWVQTDDKRNIQFCIANDYSSAISDTLIRENNSDPAWANINNYIDENGNILRNANVRFMWNQSTNKVSRSYVDGAQGPGSNNFLYILNTDSPNKIRWSEESALTSNKVTFADNGNWIYEANIQAQPNAKIRLLSNWGETNTITQYFKGSSSTTEDLVGGSGTTWYDIRVIYDFKTNRLVASYIPRGEIDDQIAINADVMFIREHQGQIDQLTFKEKDEKMGAISAIKTAYGVLRLNKWTLNNKEKTGTHEPLASPKSRYERDLFYISFPFRVSMEEVFGFGTYGTHWIIEEYDGAGRATNGYWQESDPNWKFVFNRKNKFFEPYQGYVIALDLDELGESSSVWANTDQVELYFPSYGTMPDITNASVNCTIPEHLCTINRSEELGGNGTPLGSAYDRRVKDSHWNVISVPTYVNTSNITFANTDWITTADDTHVGPNFLYEWNPDDNSVTARSGVGYTYAAMHAYLVQYCGVITWSSSVSPAAAPRRNPEYRGEYEFRLEMLQNGEAVDQTFVKLSDNEAVTTGFEFNYDLSKEFNSGKANIYTLIGTEQAAGNVLPLTDQTTVVPVGVKIAADGDYTFSMPDGTEGIGITLVDTETGIRTILSALDYTINLAAGTYDNRFFLEISPIMQTPTDVEEVTGDGLQVTGARKVIIDQKMYIIKDGKIYDAQGRQVK